MLRCRSTSASSSNQTSCHNLSLSHRTLAAECGGKVVIFLDVQCVYSQCVECKGRKMRKIFLRVDATFCPTFVSIESRRPQFSPIITSAACPPTSNRRVRCVAHPICRGRLNNFSRPFCFACWSCLKRTKKISAKLLTGIACRDFFVAVTVLVGMAGYRSFLGGYPN